MSKLLLLDALGITSGINVPHAASRMIVEVVYPEQSQHKDHPLLQNREPLPGRTAASRMIVEVVYPAQSQHKDHPLLQNPEP